MVTNKLFAECVRGFFDAYCKGACEKCAFLTKNGSCKILRTINKEMSKGIDKKGEGCLDECTTSKET